MVKRLTHEEAAENLSGRSVQLISLYTKSKDKHEFLCSCGNKFIAQYSQVAIGDVNSCGCILRVDLSGQIFSWLTVLEKLTKKKGKLFLYKYQCRCGKVVEATGHYLQTSDGASCGCKRKEDLTGKIFSRLKEARNLVGVILKKYHRKYIKKI
ncbi:hypothetical protein KAR91_24085 [Candidatus Pacearchaeota archaeon]|nr:hypothetical protein [Candidatus Pacearchaeota archaeon]